jgi:ribosomal protein S18 acetylase RimI-like enzyme
MFGVHPIQQGSGVGKQLLLAAEEYAAYLEITTIYMTVISLRTELINWYKTKGYKETGEKEPFVEDTVTGTHLKKLEFLVLQKILN